MTLRFAIGHVAGAQSSPWKLKVQGDEVYLLQRGTIAQHVKFSFHSSGNCRWARIERGVSGKERVIFEWQRGEIAPTGSGTGTPLLSIAFPTNHLSAPKANDQRQIRWIEPAIQGWALVIELFITSENETTIRKLLSEREERQLVYCKILRSGLRLCATTTQFNCGPVEMNMPVAPASPGAVFGDVIFPAEETHGTGRPIRLVLMPSDKPPPLIWELGGYDVTKVGP